MSNVVCLGLNHKTTPVEIREKLSVSGSRLQNLLLELHSEFPEVVVLSTCNRIEVYAVPPSIDGARERLTRSLLQRGGISPDELDGRWYFYSGKDAIRHLLRVASSLDSMVIGEPQILGQVKEAYFIALRSGVTSRLLNILFQQAFRVAKRVRTQTGICMGSVSVASAAVDLAEHVLGDLIGKKVLVIGTGKMGEIAAKHMVAKGVEGIMVSSRTYSHAKRLAEILGGTAVRFDRCLDEMVVADVVVGATGAPHYVITQSDMRGVMARRNGKRLLVIDIAVPGDFEARIKEIPGIELFCIDHLQYVVDAAISRRREELHRAEEIIEDELENIALSLYPPFPSPSHVCLLQRPC